MQWSPRGWAAIPPGREGSWLGSLLCWVWSRSSLLLEHRAASPALMMTFRAGLWEPALHSCCWSRLIVLLRALQGETTALQNYSLTLCPSITDDWRKSSVPRRVASEHVQDFMVQDFLTLSEQYQEVLDLVVFREKNCFWKLLGLNAAKNPNVLPSTSIWTGLMRARNFHVRFSHLSGLQLALNQGSPNYGPGDGSGPPP